MEYFVLLTVHALMVVIKKLYMIYNSNCCSKYTWHTLWVCLYPQLFHSHVPKSNISLVNMPDLSNLLPIWIGSESLVTVILAQWLVSGLD